MSDPVTTIIPPEGRSGDQGRMSVIIMYGLYFATFIVGVTAIAAVVLAYVQRDDLKGTIYESHIKNGIEIFWVMLIGGIVGAVTIFLGIGIAILFGLLVWFLYRTIKGFIRALDGKAYA